MFTFSYLLSLIVTIVVELAVVHIWARKELKSRKFYSAVVLINLVTHPSLHYLLVVGGMLWSWLGLSITITTLILEVLVIITEYFLLKSTLRVNKILGLVIAMNIISYLFGLLISFVFLFFGL